MEWIPNFGRQACTAIISHLADSARVSNIIRKN
jgi:hypothetical protein